MCRSFLSVVFNAAHMCSMGFKSGEYAGKNIRKHPAASASSKVDGERWKLALSKIITLPLGREGKRQF